MTSSFEMTGLDGANPLGFLAALGAMASLYESGLARPTLRWKRAFRWVPVLEGVKASSRDDLAASLAEALRGNPVTDEAEERLKAKKREMEEAKTAVKKKREDIGRRKLKGDQRKEVEESELDPLWKVYEEKRLEYRAALAQALPRRELGLGKRIEDSTRAEFKEYACELIATASLKDRAPLDFLAAFGSDAILDKNGAHIQPTPFSFVSGSGNQFFLDTARELISRVNARRIYETIFEPWDYRDIRLSMRWDPIEDRRYALMDRDPTSSGNEARTMWMANLLAYRSLMLFATAPAGARLGTTGWCERRDRTGGAKRQFFTWPIWEFPASLNVVQSLLQLRELVAPKPSRQELEERGIAEVYRVERIEWGSGTNRKVNFTASRRVM